jgi:NAD(P)-dependent dehydrogenase (short-subunit alcohol dehydrogenase family)
MGQFLITGAFSGLGFALSQELLNRDCHVIGLGRDIQSRSEEITCQFTDLIEIDLGQPQPEEITEKIRGAIVRYPNLNLVMNAAQIEPLGTLGSLDNTAIIEAMNVNVTSALLLMNTFLKFSLPSSSIFVIGTGAARHLIPGWDVYSIGKMGLLRSYEFIELQSPGRAMWIDPGVIDTPMQRTLQNSQWHIENVTLSPPHVVAKKIIDLIAP